jgi:hypothetical protein
MERLETMARTYAGILGLLAFATVMARGVCHQSASGETTWQASLMLFGFAAIGYAVGLTAQWIIDDSVRGRLTTEIATSTATRSENETARPAVVPQ